MKKVTPLLLMLVLLTNTHYLKAQTTLIPDANFEQRLIALGYDNITIDGKVLTANIDTVTSLDVSNLDIDDLTGIGAFTDLEVLTCAHNNLNKLDLSKNLKLTNLSCNSNLLKSLNVTQHTSITTLYCSNNQLTSLDVSQNTLLSFFVCSDNLLSCLNVKNGNNINMDFMQFYASNNPFLTCIEVDDATWATDNWTVLTENIDAKASFSTSCPNPCSADNLIDTYSSITATACTSYNSPSLNYNWTETGIYIDTIPNVKGYDSIITIDLTIGSLDKSVTQSNGVLTANESNANYQWTVCNYDSEINGAMSQSYTPIVTGLYGVEISKNGCLTTSACYTVVVTNIDEVSINNSILLYPNPAIDKLYIDLGTIYTTIKIMIKDLSGRNISSKQFNNKGNIELNIENIPSGLYFIQINAGDDQAIKKFIKK